MVVRTSSGTYDQEVLNVNELNDDLLCLILKNVPTADRLKVCPLVCKRWLDCLAPPSIAWETLDLNNFDLTTDEATRSCAAWVTKVADTVTRFRADFQASKCTTCSGCMVCAACTGYLEYVLRGLRHLSKLELETTNARTLKAISSMYQLTHLSFGNVEDCSEILAACANNLTNLRQLRVVNVRDSDETLGMSRTCNYFRLTNLTKLELFDVCTEVTPCISNLVALTELRVANLIWQSQLQLCTQIGTLTQLQVLYIHSENACSIPAELAYLQKLQKLAFCGNCCLDALDGKICSFSSLETLYLANMSQQVWGGLLDQFQQLPRLSTLSFEGCRLENLPPSIILSTNLTSLNVHNNLLEDLPHGPYLEQLQYLDISHNYLSTVPASLLHARQVKAVDLSYNSNCFKRECLQISGDAVKILSSLPRLRYLGLLRYDTEDLEEKLEEEYYRPWMNHEISCLLGLLSRLYIKGVYIDVYRHGSKCKCGACLPNMVSDPMNDGNRWF